MVEPKREDPAAIARRLVAENRYLTLGTADADGRPWASPVWFAPAAGATFLWVSSPEARHSRNIAGRPEIAIVIFDSTVPVGGAEALYVEAVAEQLLGEEAIHAVADYSERSTATGAPAWDVSDV